MSTIERSAKSRAPPPNRVTQVASRGPRTKIDTLRNSIRRTFSKDLRRSRLDPARRFAAEFEQWFKFTPKRPKSAAKDAPEPAPKRQANRPTRAAARSSPP